MIWLCPETFRKERSLAWQLAAERSKLANENTFSVEKFDQFSADQTAAATPAQLEFGINPTHRAPTFAALRAVLSQSPKKKHDDVQVTFLDANVSHILNYDANYFQLTRSWSAFPRRFQNRFAKAQPFRCSLVCDSFRCPSSSFLDI